MKKQFLSDEDKKRIRQGTEAMRECGSNLTCASSHELFSLLDEITVLRVALDKATYHPRADYCAYDYIAAAQHEIEEGNA